MEYFVIELIQEDWELNKIKTLYIVILGEVPAKGSREVSYSFQENAGDCVVGCFGRYVGALVNTSVFHKILATSKYRF